MPRISFVAVLGIGLLASSPLAAQQGQVKAESSGIAIGGGVSYSTIISGVPLEEAVAAYREALKEFTQERTPRNYENATENLNGALSSLEERRGK